MFRCFFVLILSVVCFIGCGAADIDDSKVDAKQSPFIGIMPDYSAPDLNGGVRIAGVAPGGPAHSAGIISGEVIVKVAGNKITGIRDWNSQIGRLEIGRRIELIVRNGDRERIVTVIPTGR